MALDSPAKELRGTQPIQRELETDGNSVPITDLRGAVAQKSAERRKTWHALVKHGVTLVLLLTLAVFIPAILLILHGRSESDEQFDSVMQLFQIWLTAVITLAGTAVGFYFRTSRSTSDGD